MIRIETYRDKRVGVYGLGRTGMSVVRRLLAGGAEVLCWDDDPGRREAGNRLGAAAIEPTAKSWRGIVALVLSPGIPFTHPEPHPVVRMADEIGAEVLGDIELFARARPEAPVIAVTGTNGKSTTTSLIGHLLNALGRNCLAGGNLGKPVLDFDVLGAEDAYALELSSYQIDLTRSLRPAVSMLINISPDHLDRHGGMDGYVAAKYRLFEMADADTRMVIGVDDEWSANIAKHLIDRGARVACVSARGPLADGIFVDENGRLFAATGGRHQLLRDLAGIENLRGSHNWQNAACAIAALSALGFDPLVASEFLDEFAGLAHRMEIVAEIDGVRFVNDSKATNAQAAAQALAAYDRIYWIAGGIAKQGGIDSLSALFAKVAKAFLIGEAAESFSRQLSPEVAVAMPGDLQAAVEQAFSAARQDNDVPGGVPGVVLLSPACASFDQFESFEARGDAFRDLVLALEAAHLSGNPKQAGGAA